MCKISSILASFIACRIRDNTMSWIATGCNYCRISADRHPRRDRCASRRTLRNGIRVYRQERRLRLAAENEPQGMAVKSADFHPILYRYFAGLRLQTKQMEFQLFRRKCSIFNERIFNMNLHRPLHRHRLHYHKLVLALRSKSVFPIQNKRQIQCHSYRWRTPNTSSFHPRELELEPSQCHRGSPENRFHSINIQKI